MTDPRVTLILASGSPQRRALLEQAGYPFRVVAPSPHAECGVCSRETPGELVARLARQKAANVVQRLPDAEKGAGAVVGCDTVAECRGQILGKPASRQHADQMLHWLSGQEHHVYSGLCVWPLAAGEPRVEVAVTRLRMDSLSDQEIEEYLDSGLWEGKAGEFGYQDRVGWLRIVEGSESNVVGLPLELLGDMLTAVFGSGQVLGPPL